MRPARNPVTLIIILVLLVAVGVVTGFGLGGEHRSAAADPAGKSAGIAGSGLLAAERPTGPSASGDPKSEDHTLVQLESSSYPFTTAPPPKVQAVPGLPALACPNPTVTVHDGAELQSALNAAHPGTVIHLDNGVYYGRFVGTGAGTASDPIWVCGGPMAILDDSQRLKGPPPPEGSGSYGFHLVSASRWNLVGFSIRNGQKGLVLDHSSHNTVYGLSVYNIGDEAIHLREFSSDNVVEGCVVRDTGLREAKYGEGIYLGTAVSNWPTYTAGKPDASNGNKVLYNNISRTTAESVDVKEGTSGGEIAFNHFDGTGMVAEAATSWVNVKGNDYSITSNTGLHSIGNGFSTHKIVKGSGTGNVFSKNHIGVGVAEYGFDFDSHPNTLACNNTGQGKKGQSNVRCTD